MIEIRQSALNEHPILNAFRNDELLRNGDFRRYWSSAILNGFGSYISALAVPLCAVLLLKASPAQMGMMGAAATLPYALLSLPAGVFLDRNRKLPILLISKTIQALALASIPLAWWLGVLTVQWMYVMSFVTGACMVVGGGAEQVFLTNMIGRDKLTDAQSKFTATDSIARLVAPGFAGVLIQWLSAPYAVLLNALSFVVSIGLLRKLKANDPKPAPSNKHPLRDIHDGFLFIWRQPLLRTLAWTSGCWHALFYGFGALQIIFATRELGMSAGMLGVAQMIGGIGVLGASMLLKPLTARFGATGTMQVGMALCTLTYIVQPLIPANLFGYQLASVTLCASMSLFLDCGVMLFLLPCTTMRQKVTPDAYLGRMMSTMRFLIGAVAPVGALVGGYLGEHFSVRTGLACVGAAAVLLLAAVSLSPAVRQKS